MRRCIDVIGGIVRNKSIVPMLPLIIKNSLQNCQWHIGVEGMILI